MSWLIKKYVCFLLLFATSLSLIGKAQQTAAVLQPVAGLLQQELKKAGLTVPVHTAATRPAASGFQLALLNTEEAALYKLVDKPADAFYIKSTKQSVYVGSTTVDGLRNGVYWYLHQLGFRYYFPHEAWHVVPRLATAYMALEKTVAPSYHHRRIWYAYGTDSKRADADYAKWFEANLLGGEQLVAGHAYDAIVNRNKAIFLQHPEYFAQHVQRGQIPPDPKFEVSNEALVQLCIRDAMNQIETARQKTGVLPGMISMDPSDGGGFSTSPASLKIGGPSEQTFYLANRVAKSVRQKYPSVRIGLYAYFTHTVPPQFDLEPNIVVLVATALNLSEYRTDELIERWRKKGVGIGIRDYYGVMAWDWDMPSMPNGSKINYVTGLKTYHADGIRLFTAETNIGWISRGLGHYTAARLLWDATTDVEKTSGEFFDLLFGKAAPPMQQLYQRWQAYNQPTPALEDMAVWYGLVQQAADAEADAAVQARLDQVKQYLQYVFLYQQWKGAGTDENLIALLNYAYRVKDNGAVASYPLMRRLANSAVKGKANMRFNDPDAIWKRNSSPVTKKETEQTFTASVKSLKGVKQTAATVYPELFQMPMVRKKNGGVKSMSAPANLRGGHRLVFRLDAPAGAALHIQSGTIKAQAFKTLRLQIYRYRGGLSFQDADLVLDTTVQPKQPLIPIPLQALKSGSYSVAVDDAKAGFNITFSGAVAYAIVADKQSPAWTIGRNTLYFNVPKGTAAFTIQTAGVMTVQSPSGRVVDLQKPAKEPVVVPVLNGEQGVWQLQRQNGVFFLQGVLPFVCPDLQFLLIP